VLQTVSKLAGCTVDCAAMLGDAAAGPGQYFITAYLNYQNVVQT
jgi:hypothetical protein